MEFRVLGPVEIRGPAGPVRLGGSRLLTLTSALLVNANRVVSVDQLVDAVWDEDPPDSGVAVLHTHVHRLRRSLEAAEPDGGERVATHPDGYQLRVDPGELDLDVFLTRMERGRVAAAGGRFEVAAHELYTALALWRGPALAGVRGQYLRTQAFRLDEEHLAAVEERIDVDLAVGKNAELIAELQDLVAAHPLRERLPGQLMLALHRSGRQAEALEVFKRARRTLVDEVGVEPGPELQALQQRILRSDPELLATTERQAGRNDLLGDLSDFTGRATETEQLLAAVVKGDETTPTAVMIEAIDGMAGAGKTALAVHVAHRLADRYPDAQLFIDLHGHTRGQSVTDPMAALDTLLRALGVPGEQIPGDLDARSALWRAELAGRRVLVVLDNAATAAQVRPLLPGSSGCLTLVTSRRRLVDLEVTHLVSLDVLSIEDAVNLFTTIVGEERSGAEPVAVIDVAQLCGCLPLAIRIAATRLRTRPAWTVGHLAERLRGDGRQLDELAAGDRSVAAAFKLSYEMLTEDQQRLFRLLGLHEGPDFDAYAAASLAGTGLGAAERLLEELVDVHLLQQPMLGRYRFHDLLRQHAWATAHEVEPEAGRLAATTRLVGHYLHTAGAAARLLERRLPSIEVGEPPAGCVVRPLKNLDVALAWFDAEHPSLHAMHQLALARGERAEVWRLTWAMHAYHHRRGQSHDNLATLRTGVDAAQELGDPRAYGLALQIVAHAYAQTGNDVEALRHAQKALELAESTGDHLYQTLSHLNLAWILVQQREVMGALGHATQALQGCENFDDPLWEGEAVNCVGWFNSLIGNYPKAKEYCERSLALARKRHDPDGQANALSVLGEVAHHLGRYREAIAYHREAVAIRQASGYTYEEANSLAFLGEAYLAVGEYDRARHAWHHALDIYRTQHRAMGTEHVQQQLAALDAEANARTAS